MKKNFNVIQINGTKGIIMAIFIACCLFAGFVVFPGWICMNLWNYASSYAVCPSIGLFQGVLLWGIIASAYFIFRKERVVVCVKNPQGLDEEELKAVFADLKKHSQEDPVLKAMLKAREAELKIKTLDADSSEVENSSEQTKIS